MSCVCTQITKFISNCILKNNDELLTKPFFLVNFCFLLVNFFFLKKELLNN